jgi:hypothetical protein
MHLSSEFSCESGDCLLLRNCDIGTKGEWKKNSQQRNYNHNFNNDCDNYEHKYEYLSIPAARATVRDAKYCTVSPRTIQRIRNEINNCVLNDGLSTPRKKWKCPEVRNAEMDDLLKIFIYDKR